MKKEFDAEITYIDMDNPSYNGISMSYNGIRMFAKLRADDLDRNNAVSFWMKSDEVPGWVGKRLHVTVEAAE